MASDIDQTPAGPAGDEIPSAAARIAEVDEAQIACFLAVAHRWGQSNGHWYFIYCGGDYTKAAAMAAAECGYRGGKYGCAVYGFTGNGDEHKLLDYFPSSMEATNASYPTHNHRIDYFERLGMFANDAAVGKCLLPDPRDPEGRRLTYQPVECPAYMKAEVERQRKIYQAFVAVDDERDAAAPRATANEVKS